MLEDDALEKETGKISYTAPEYNQDIDFLTMAPEETAELISYVYSYGEWFGMNELGCMTGELRGLQDEIIIMYRWKEGRSKVYFVPKSKVNTCLKFGDGEYYPVYVNRDGEMEFFYIERNSYAGESVQLKTSYFIQDHYFSDLDMRYSEDMVCLGEEDSYYFRYLIVKSGKGNYYFWPAGFGLNGSLEECEAQRHYMNALCIERTKQLERCSIVIGGSPE